MGLILSCCRESDLDENEALLASQQNGYNNGNDDYNALQHQIREHEERLRARENALKEIVTNTNDKLIDISMISNSGIVVQGSDLSQQEPDSPLENASGSAVDDSHETSATQNNSRKSNFTALDTTTAMSTEMKRHLKLLHERIFETLEQELHVEPQGRLVVSLQ